MRTLVMGIVNATPDSFSDGGKYFSAKDAISHGEFLITEGADILDIGGESTRPGAERVGLEEEIRRVIPVIQGLRGAQIPISVDTMNSQVATLAVEAGATIVNDVSGGYADPKMFATVASLGVDYVLGHWPIGSDGTLTHQRFEYEDVLSQVKADLLNTSEQAKLAGIPREKIILDPGLGFAKNAEDNWAILAGIQELTPDFRVLVGASRKKFLGHLLAEPEPEARDDATAAITGWVAERGVWAVRTHRISNNLATVKVINQLREQTQK